MKVLHEVAQKTISLRRERARLALAIKETQALLEQHETLITPPEGWPGKNVEARADAKEKALLANEFIFEQRETLKALESEYALTSADLECLGDERRAYEWSIRASLVEYLLGKGLDINPDRAYDYEADEEVFTHAMIEGVPEAQPKLEPQKTNSGYIEDDIPF